MCLVVTQLCPGRRLLLLQLIQTVRHLFSASKTHACNNPLEPRNAVCHHSTYGPIFGRHAKGRNLSYYNFEDRDNCTYAFQVIRITRRQTRRRRGIYAVATLWK